MAATLPVRHTNAAASFSSFEAAIQRQVLGADREAFAEKSGKFVRPFLLEQHVEFYSSLSFVYIGLSDTSGQPVALVLVGNPGFMRALSPTQMAIRPRQQLSPDLLRPGIKLGFLGMEAHTRRRNRLNARVESLDTSTNTLTMSVLQSYGNCPKYIQSRHFSILPDDGQAKACMSSASMTSSPLDEQAMALIQRSDCIFIASHLRREDNGGVDESAVGADVSHRGGPPGFVKALSPSRLQWPDYIGNYFFQTIGNIMANGHAGLLFIDYTDGSSLQISGHAWVDMHDTSLPGAQRAVNVDVHSWQYTRNCLPIRQVGQTESSPYNPTSGNAADKRFVKCVKIQDAALGIKTFTFSYPEPAGIGKAEPFTYQPGQYAAFDFQLGGKVHNRTWTISSHPDESMASHTFHISVKKAGLISTYLHEQLTVGSAAEWRGAAGEFVAEPGSNPVLLIAGGIGITPMRAFLLDFAKQGRPATLLYSVRVAAEVAFLPELEQLAHDSAGTIKVIVNVTQKDPEWKGNKGRINEAYISAQVPRLLDFSDAYMCGPGPFMDGVEAALTALSFPASRIHSESFAF